MKKCSAYSTNICKQKGLVANPILLIIGVIVGLMIILASSGALKFDAKFSNTNQPHPERQIASPGSSLKSKAEETRSGLKKYANKNEGLTLMYPANWSMEENPAAGVMVAFGSPQESSSDTFVDNVNVSISDLSSKPDMTLDEVSNLWQKQTEEDLAAGAFKLSEIKTTTLAGQDAKRLVFTYSLQGKNIKGMVVIALKDKKAYIITYTAERTSYDKFENAANTIISSLQVN